MPFRCRRFTFLSLDQTLLAQIKTPSFTAPQFRLRSPSSASCLSHPAPGALPSTAMEESQETTFLCCSSITVRGDEQNQVHLYIKHYQDMLCLGKNWRGKVIPREAQHVSVSQDKYPRGIIRVLELEASDIKDTNWYAVAGTPGPYGKVLYYVQLDPTEVEKALASRHLVESTTCMRYDTCPNHTNREFEACWYKFEQPKPAPSTGYSQWYDDVDSEGNKRTTSLTNTVSTPKKGKARRKRLSLRARRA